MKIINSEFDTYFNNMDDLKWFPFVGNNYQKAQNKILMIGESHYYNPKIPSDTIEQKMFTRWVTDELGLCNREYKDGSNFFKVVNKHFAKNKIDAFWNKIAFYNFIQRPMLKNENVNQRPSSLDFNQGWEVFFKVVEILKPKYCLFLGNSCADYFNESVNHTKFPHEKIIWLDKVNRAYFKYGSLAIADDSKIKLFFIRHPSKFFSAEKWIDVLHKKENQLIESLIE